MGGGGGVLMPFFLLAAAMASWVLARASSIESCFLLVESARLRAMVQFFFKESRAWSMVRKYLLVAFGVFSISAQPVVSRYFGKVSGAFISLLALTIYMFVRSFRESIR